MQKRVLILCTGNSARSQMAEGLLRELAGERYEVVSAGVSPTRVRPEAIAVMRELSIDISSHRSKSVDEFLNQNFDFVITVCDNAKEQCPVFSGPAQRIHWGIDDPATVTVDEQSTLDAFRATRDDLRARLKEFISSDS